MESLTFKVGTDAELVLGYTGETNATSVTFENFVLSDEANTMYFIVDAPLDKMIPLTDNAFTVTSAMTTTNFRTTGQLAEVAPDNTMVRKSDTFSVTVNKGLAVNLSNILA